MVAMNVEVVTSWVANEDGQVLQCQPADDWMSLDHTNGLGATCPGFDRDRCRGGERYELITDKQRLRFIRAALSRAATVFGRQDDHLAVQLVTSPQDQPMTRPGPVPGLAQIYLAERYKFSWRYEMAHEAVHVVTGTDRYQWTLEMLAQTFAIDTLREAQLQREVTSRRVV
jgi:hypothetical protein